MSERKKCKKVEGKKTKTVQKRQTERTVTHSNREKISMPGNTLMMLIVALQKNIKINTSMGKEQLTSRCKNTFVNIISWTNHSNIKNFYRAKF